MNPTFQNIRNIIFDFGGVILNIDYRRTERAFVGLGIVDFGDRFSQLRQTTIFDDLETGKIGRVAFLEQMSEIAGRNVTHRQLEDAWNAMLIDIPLRRLQLLQQLQLHYHTILLSNTNEIHETCFNKLLKQVCGYENMAVFFDKVYYSHRMGMRKPHKETFEAILKENNLDPQQTLFIDDSPQHIEGAKLAGIHTIYLAPGMTFENDIFKPKTTN
ncbi:MAG: HAD family phosphatase [Edaphocola sp.]